MLGRSETFKPEMKMRARTRITESWCFRGKQDKSSNATSWQELCHDDNYGNVGMSSVGPVGNNANDPLNAPALLCTIVTVSVLVMLVFDALIVPAKLQFE